MKRYRVTRRYIAEEVVEVDAHSRTEALDRAIDALVYVGDDPPGNPSVLSDGAIVRNFQPVFRVLQ